MTPQLTTLFLDIFIQLKGAWRRARKQKLRKRGRVKRAKMQRCKDLPQGEGLKPICQRRFFCMFVQDVEVWGTSCVTYLRTCDSTTHNSVSRYFYIGFVGYEPIFGAGPKTAQREGQMEGQKGSKGDLTHLTSIPSKEVKWSTSLMSIARKEVKKAK